MQAVRRARRARWEAVILTPVLAAVIWAYSHREELFGVDLPVRIASVIALIIFGWAFARALGRSLGPYLFRRLEAGTAGTVGFLIRLLALTAAALGALRIAGLNPQTLAVGGAFTAVIFGLAAQQTFGNLVAGTVLLSARPFRVGDRVRLQAGPLAGQVEGVVSALGLLYTTLAQGEDQIMVPNSVVLASAVVPLREPAGVDLRARLSAGVKPSYVQEVLQGSITVPTRAQPHIGLEEVDGREVLMRIAATPESGSDGPKLADEILAAMAEVTETLERGEAQETEGGKPRQEEQAGGVRTQRDQDTDGGEHRDDEGEAQRRWAGAVNTGAWWPPSERSQ